MEPTAPSASHHVWHLCEEAVFLTKDLATVTTSAAQDTWRPVFDRLIQTDASNAVLRTRWRPSRNGG
eukprot:529013-Pyramimonas_sp.AAC.1